MKFILEVNDWESTRSWELHHELKTEEEFKQDVNRLIVSLADDLFIKSRHTFKGSDKIHNALITTEDWIEFIIPYLKDLGYYEKEEEGFVYSFDSVGLFRRKGINSNRFVKIIGKDLLARVRKHNSVR